MVVAQKDRMRGKVGGRDAVDVGTARDCREFSVVGLVAVAGPLPVTLANLRQQDEPGEDAEEEAKEEGSENFREGVNHVGGGSACLDGLVDLQGDCVVQSRAFQQRASELSQPSTLDDTKGTVTMLIVQKHAEVGQRKTDEVSRKA